MKKRSVKHTAVIILGAILIVYCLVRRLTEAETPFGLLMLILGIVLYELISYRLGKRLQESVKDAPFQKDLKEKEE